VQLGVQLSVHVVSALAVHWLSHSVSVLATHAVSNEEVSQCF